MSLMNGSTVGDVKPVLTPQDRSISVAPGTRVVTGYVAIEQIRMANRSRMAVGDVEAAYRKQLALGDHQAFPCPNGRWDGERFVLLDGRHAFISALMLGFTHLLVAWTEGAAHDA